MTAVQVKLITDPEQFLMWESPVMGGVAYIYQKHAQVNQPDLIECGQEHKLYSRWDESKDNGSLFYIDANALYAKCISQYLPTGGFHMYNVG